LLPPLPMESDLVQASLNYIHLHDQTVPYAPCWHQKIQ
jgi:hypothetical protein